MGVTGLPCIQQAAVPSFAATSRCLLLHCTAAFCVNTVGSTAQPHRCSAVARLLYCPEGLLQLHNWQHWPDLHPKLPAVSSAATMSAAAQPHRSKAIARLLCGPESLCSVQANLLRLGCDLPKVNLQLAATSLQLQAVLLAAQAVAAHLVQLLQAQAWLCQDWLKVLTQLGWPSPTAAVGEQSLRSKQRSSKALQRVDGYALAQLKDASPQNPQHHLPAGI